MYFLKLCLRRQFLVAIKLVRAFLGIVEKWFWRLSVGAVRTLKWGSSGLLEAGSVIGVVIICDV